MKDLESENEKSSIAIINSQIKNYTSLLISNPCRDYYLATKIKQKLAKKLKEKKAIYALEKKAGIMMIYYSVGKNHY